jgi:hypothetical protein
VVIWAEHNICNGLANKGDLERDSEEIVAEYFNHLKQYNNNNIQYNIYFLNIFSCKHFSLIIFLYNIAWW